MASRGTILVTGSNGSLAVPMVEHLLKTYSQFTLVLAVRNPSAEDVNTRRLLDIVGPYCDRVHVRALDLARLSDVNQFASSLATDITTSRLPPLSSIICNAFYWNLTGDTINTRDGFEQTCSDAHWPGKNGLETYPPALPDDLDSLRTAASPPNEVSPVGGAQGQNPLGWGFQRYAIAKLAVTMWMYALNARLEATTCTLHGVTAIAGNPGNLSDSRALRVNTPAKLQFISRFVIQPLQPLLKYKDPTMRTAAEAGIDAAELAVDPQFTGAKGYFTWKKQDTSSPESLDAVKQQRLWEKTLEWVGLAEEDLPL
ncbi:hypothetical protein BDV27DRAFT_153503 [Aspergillus caelatus]|uniref:Ketoreductase (KR) domain-containing protein n=1 Tax=Aspergillus caelatus TaxID=61420 RepID=A0A5N7AGT2_9EURO|nr:uncharacterized protein BDV27DRAFT_153503 [Aspergillus caelatus]KAE8369052.1 hypothetical protein BDV27DRAFT_153503 [Aspergillus caelatus]